MEPRAQRHVRVAREKFTPWQQGALIAAIIIAVAWVYLPALRGNFVWDDFLLITGNPLLQSASGLLEIWSGGRTADYFPLTNTVLDRKSTRLNSSHMSISYAVFCLKKK